MYVINPDRTWKEPWRFLTYGFVHNDMNHLLGNAFSQLCVGLPLEFSHSSWRVALVYLSGIVVGGFGREVYRDHFTEDPSTVILAGASGNCYIIIKL